MDGPWNPKMINRENSKWNNCKLFKQMLQYKSQIQDGRKPINKSLNHLI